MQHDLFEQLANATFPRPSSEARIDSDSKSIDEDNYLMELSRGALFEANTGHDADDSAGFRPDNDQITKIVNLFTADIFSTENVAHMAELVFEHNFHQKRLHEQVEWETSNVNAVNPTISELIQDLYAAQADALWVFQPFKKINLASC